MAKLQVSKFEPLVGVSLIDWGWDGELAQQFGARAALMENPGSSPNTYMHRGSEPSVNFGSSAIF